jgi:hypothetical protein
MKSLPGQLFLKKTSKMKFSLWKRFMREGSGQKIEEVNEFGSRNAEVGKKVFGG